VPNAVITFRDPLTNNVALLQSMVNSSAVAVMCVSPSPRACAVGAASTGAIKHAAAARNPADRVMPAPFAYLDGQSVRAGGPGW
jgi:hypothetical protein